MENNFTDIQPFDGDVSSFGEIFIPWLKQITGKEPEPEDIEAVTQLDKFYIQPGGMVFYAWLNNQVVGCVAVKRLDDENFEFCKLVVLESGRGLGLGKRLVERCISYSKENGGKRLYLQTFNRLDLAIRMYERMGFLPAQPPKIMNVLSRTEIIMNLDLR